MFFFFLNLKKLMETSINHLPLLIDFGLWDSQADSVNPVLIEISAIMDLEFMRRSESKSMNVS